MSEIKERPILFSGEMVRAILDGKKTQTRRVMRGPPPDTDPSTDWAWHKDHDGTWWAYDGEYPDEGHYDKYRCPYGKPGDLLVPRTTWAVSPVYDARRPVEIGLPRERPLIWSYWLGESKPDWCGKSRPGRFMPKTLWWALPRLRVTDVRVERVQEISEAGCMAEGVLPMCNHDTAEDVRMGFESLWDSINAKRGVDWDSNPWVWVISFEPVEVRRG